MELRMVVQLSQSGFLKKEVLASTAKLGPLTTLKLIQAAEDLLLALRNVLMDFDECLRATFIKVSDIVNLQRKFRVVDL